MCKKDDCPIKHPKEDQVCCCGGTIYMGWTVTKRNLIYLFLKCDKCEAVWSL